MQAPTPRRIALRGALRAVRRASPRVALIDGFSISYARARCCRALALVVLAVGASSARS